MLQIQFTKYEKSILINGQSVSLALPIINAIALNDRVVIHVDPYGMPPADPHTARNVFALDGHGKELWRIADLGHTYQADDGKHYSLPWSAIAKRPDGSGYWIYSHSGYRFDFDPMTGKVAERGDYVH